MLVHPDGFDGTIPQPGAGDGDFDRRWRQEASRATTPAWLAPVEAMAAATGQQRSAQSGALAVHAWLTHAAVGGRAQRTAGHLSGSVEQYRRWSRANRSAEETLRAVLGQRAQ